MLALRSLLFYLGISLNTLFFTATGPLLFFLPPLLRNAYMMKWGFISTWWLKVTCNIDYKIDGLDKLPRETCVVLAKHQSAWETIAFQTILPPHTWVLKRELLWIPVFGWGLAQCIPIAINRGSRKQALKQVIRQGTKRLNSGLWVIIFPEGTRMLPGTQGKYGIGGAMLAEKANHPVVPIAHNAGEYWPKRGFLKYPGTIHVVIGDPIYPNGKRSADINAEAEAWIEARMAEITNESGRVAQITADNS